MDDVFLGKLENCKEKYTLVYFGTYIYAKPFRAHVFNTLNPRLFSSFFLSYLSILISNIYNGKKLLYSGHIHDHD